MIKRVESMIKSQSSSNLNTDPKQKRDTAIVILSAGSSSRMGRPKSLLDWNGRSLLDFQIKKFSQSVFDIQDIYVILGSDATQIKASLYEKKTQFFEFANWEEGMSSTIAFATSELSSKNYQNLIFLAVDQPFVSSEHVYRLLEKQKSTGRGIIQSKSLTGWSGIPVLFNRRYFRSLSKLHGDTGAKSIVQNHQDDVQTVLAESKVSLIDMDSPEAYHEALELARSAQ